MGVNIVGINIVMIISWLLSIIVPIGIIVGIVLYFKKRNKDKSGIP